MCEMDTDSAYIAILGESVESSVKPELRVSFIKISATSFQELICLNIKPVIRESQSYLKWSGKDKESWACVVNVVVLYCSTVLGRKRSFLAKGSIKNVTTLTKINMILMI